jgi:hypothetical protein
MTAQEERIEAGKRPAPLMALYEELVSPAVKKRVILALKRGFEEVGDL